MDAVEDVKSRLNIEDVIGQYVQLKRSGRNFKGLSPFTSEKTASFMVSPEKQIWHDFSSGKGGNMFSFVMEMEGLDFRATLELLARQAGIDLSQYESKQSGTYAKQRDRLMLATEMAAKFYQLHLSKNKFALEYARKKRSFSKETIVQFRLGYAPDSQDALTTFLKKKGFSEEELKRAGLSTSRYRGLGDMFRGRLMIPLMDPVGKVIGFTARILKDEPGSPKYINTPQTPLYDKSRHVFGLHLAKTSIRKQKYAVMVEGNMDVIAAHQAGTSQVVATAGTALTEMQLKALSRLTHDIRLAFDQDEAGIAATERSIPIAGKTGVTLSVIDIPSGKDPDELIQKDPKAWEEALEKHLYAVDWLIERYAQLVDTTTALGKREFTDKILGVVRNITDSVEQDHFILQLSERIGVSQDALRTKMNSLEGTAARPVKRTNVKPAKVDTEEAESLKTQHQLLALVLLLPSLREYGDPLTVDMFLEPEAQAVLRFLQANPDYSPKTHKKKTTSSSSQADTLQDGVEERTESYQAYEKGVPETTTKQGAANSSGVLGSAQEQAGMLRGTGDFVKMLGLLYEELYLDHEVLELRHEAAGLQTRLVQQYVKTQKARLAEAMQASDETQTDELLEQAKKLDVLLKRTKEIKQ